MSVDPARWRASLLELASVPVSESAVDPARPATRMFRFVINALLVRGAGHVVLIDTGTGAMAETIGIATDLDAALSDHDIAREEVDVVIVTHFDADHVGGCLRGTWPDDVRAAFPEARIVASRREVDAALTAESPMIFEGGRPAVRALGGSLHLAEDGDEVVPGVRLRLAAGHTPGHSWVEIDGDPPLAFLGDLVHGAFQIEDLGPSRLDRDPSHALETRRRVLGELADRGFLVFFAHIPGPVPGRILRVGTDAFRWSTTDRRP